MAFEDCARLVERADPMRFRAAMAAPLSARRILFALYAFNIEVSRAPWVTKEPMIAEMRLQWWRDVLEEVRSGGPVRRHEVTDELAAVLDPEGAETLDALIAARRWDVYSDTFEDQAHFEAYIDATSGGLMWTAARLLGAEAEAPVRDIAYGSGVAGFLQAIPALEEAGRKPLIDGTPEGVRSLARSALARLKQGRAAQKAVAAPARPALLPAHASVAVLRRAAKMPELVVKGALAPSALRDRMALARAALTGRV
ncbi:phytoene synthase [Salipiger sp. IMCC34102]|uniref:squalene/phytoene synthase family protein n=1 Tax=Salipiger sp. IMCC34102 TaxID=2510647 RepID=UPI00101BB10D|nr:squalene/phytoene synthase family protein [Salipiger sp. IMCC34102]RYH03460.1 phytoene synthase [Salipiger sp. IMCC34102]